MEHEHQQQQQQQPLQPNMQQAYHQQQNRPPPQPWRESKWACCSPFGDCLLSCCCPCILYGTTSQRLEPQKGNDVSKHETFDTNCMIHFAATCVGFGWILQAIQRQQIRTRYNLEGTGAGDFCFNYCCPCCGLMQQDKEVKDRVANDPAVTGVNTAAYQPQPGMVLQPQMSQSQQPQQPQQQYQQQYQQEAPAPGYTSPEYASPVPQAK